MPENQPAPSPPLKRIALSTGISLDVATMGERDAPAMIFLHGFPESHRTWRRQLPAFAADHFCIAPDQRGYARSDKPEGVGEYTPDKPVADLLALADHFGIGQFTLVGHDWGGAIAWMAALQHPGRVARLVIVNAPHPLIFQRSMFDVPEQAAASQYIRAFRSDGIDAHIERIGIESFFDTTFVKHADPALMAPEKPAYLDEWSQPGAIRAMLNWYRASAIQVPAPGETPERPAFLDAPFPPVTQPTLVIWGMRDTALLPCQLDGLDALVPDLTIERIEAAGHFAPWETPEAVNAALRRWIDGHKQATGA
ncbi:alpha/beta fold hydrolase [Sphingomonas baiyangensis]|uniref:Alpha/beta hydrolase n=1 Tax=Sphingomonas baiyangensis TaxID=2572576 RepID=A0A4U1L6B0_9SPHN|nr:alpha/beta hydrolase [Sphingomonas baiyangensis]TKD51800.1 alpha/beta hydrolase [Sphingomonas baiyangensis]